MYALGRVGFRARIVVVSLNWQMGGDFPELYLGGCRSSLTWIAASSSSALDRALFPGSNGVLSDAVRLVRGPEGVADPVRGRRNRRRR